MIHHRTQMNKESAAVLNKAAAWFRELVRRVVGDMTPDEVRDLVLCRHHNLLVQRRRAVLIVSRVRLVAAIFAILTPLWIVVDMLVFPWPLWGWLALLRIAATAAFFAVALGFANVDRMGGAYRALGSLLLIPTLFFIISHPLLAQADLSGLAAMVAVGYAFLSFVMVAGLSVFPITLLEGLIFGTPMILAQAGTGLTGHTILDITAVFGALWLLGLLLVVAILAAMSQLHFMMALVNQASHDGLTATFTRRVGEELLERQFQHAARHDTPLSVVFIDLDNFKAINDLYSHEHGDAVLATTAESLFSAMRAEDILVRWGGEEFLIVMPNTDCTGAAAALQRCREAGLGPRPDSSPVTASIGIAERVRDGIRTWPDLVATADRRMYLAKDSGKDRIICCDQDRAA